MGHQYRILQLRLGHASGGAEAGCISVCERIVFVGPWTCCRRMSTCSSWRRDLNKRCSMMHICTVDRHLAGLCNDPLDVAVPILAVLAWTNVMSFMNECLSYMDGTYDKKGYDNPERNLFIMTIHHDEFSRFHDSS